MNVCENKNKIDNEYQDAIGFLEFLIQCFDKECISKNNEKLLDLLFLKNPSQSDLNGFLADYDIETRGSYNALLLANFMKENPHLEFDSSVKPRLDGLLNFFRFKNTKKLDFLSKLIKTLNQNSIKFVALGDFSVKDLMAETINISNNEFIVDSKTFGKIPSILKKSKYTFAMNKKKTCIQIKNEEEMSVSIKLYPDLDTGHKNLDYFLEAIYKSPVVNNSLGEMQMPEIEHLAFIEMINLAKIIKFNLNFEDGIQTIYKIKNFIKGKNNFDWNIVINDAKSTKTGVQLKLSAIYLNKIIPKLLPEILNDDNLFRQEIIIYHSTACFRKYYNDEIRPNYKKNTLLNLIKGILSLFNDYFSSKTEYLKAKIAKRSPKLMNKYFKNMRNQNEIK